MDGVSETGKSEVEEVEITRAHRPSDQQGEKATFRFLKTLYMDQLEACTRYKQQTPPTPLTVTVIRDHREIDTCSYKINGQKRI